MSQEKPAITPENQSDDIVMPAIIEPLADSAATPTAVLSAVGTQQIAPAPEDDARDAQDGKQASVPGAPSASEPAAETPTETLAAMATPTPVPTTEACASSTVTVAVPLAPTTNTARSKRRTFNTAPELVARLAGDCYDGSIVAETNHAMGFDIIPLGAVNVFARNFANKGDAKKHFDTCIAPLGGHCLGLRPYADMVRATFTAPASRDGVDRSKIPIIKNWPDAECDITWWNPGEVVPLPRGQSDWGTDRSGQPILVRKGDSRRNVGNKTGSRSGVVGVDLDNHADRNGLESLRALYGDRLTELFPETFTVETPSGGLHWYYSIENETKIPCSAGVLAPGVDIRGEGGMLVAPGSIRLNGRRYTVTKPVPVAPLPAETILILQGLKGAKKGSGGTAAVATPKQSTSPAAQSGDPQSCYISRDEALNKVLAKYQSIAPGTRHATLLSVAGSLRNLLEDDNNLEWAIRRFAAERRVDTRDPADLEAIITTAKTFTRSPPPHQKVEIIASLDQAQVIRELERVVATIPTVYQRDGQLVSLFFSGDSRRPTIRGLVVEALGPATTDFVEWQKLSEGKDGEEVVSPIAPPYWAIAGLLQSPSVWSNIRVLEGVVPYPIMRPDGTMVTSAGYDSQTKVLVLNTFGSLDIPSNPTQDDAHAAALEVLDVVQDFPFADASGPSVFLAAILTPLCRFAGIGSVPLFLFDKAQPGTGGSLLADVLGIILTGARLRRLTQPNSDDEQRKVITSILCEGSSIILIDNALSAIGGGPIDALTTGDQWFDRPLGRTEMLSFTNRVTFVITGNNLMLKGDTPRRCLRLRLEAKDEHPDQRDGFKYPTLIEHVLKHRPNLLRAVVIMLVAYVCNGRAQLKPPKWGGFEGLCDLVCGAIRWARMPDPTLGRIVIDDTTDPARQELVDLLMAWNEMDSDGRGVTSSVIARRLQLDYNGIAYPHFREFFMDKMRHVMKPGQIGAKLNKYKGRVIGNFRLMKRTDTERNVGIWYVESLGGEAPQTPPTTPVANDTQTAQTGAPATEPVATPADDAATVARAAIAAQSDPSFDPGPGPHEYSRVVDYVELLGLGK